jgi:hypothetical protein
MLRGTHESPQSLDEGALVLWIARIYPRFRLAAGLNQAPDLFPRVRFRSAQTRKRGIAVSEI